MSILQLLHTATGGEPDWERLRRDHFWAEEMAGYRPDGEANRNLLEEGERVIRALRALPEYGDRPQEQREALELAALLHALGEPATRRDEEGRIRGPGPSILGQIRARRILWEERTPFRTREAACALIRYQHLPFHPGAGSEAVRRILAISIASRCDLVAILGEALVRAGIRRRDDALAAVDSFRERAAELGCLDLPFRFASAHSRFLYFRRPDRNPFYQAHDDTRGEVVLLAGLPGSGKSTWISTRAPSGYELVGLDEMREEMGIRPTENQGPVVQATREHARRIMGDKLTSRSIVWNATNLSRRRREPILALCDAYRYRARIVYIEVPPSTLDRQNHERERPVPADAIERMMLHWELPDRTEAHAVEYHVREEREGPGDSSRG
jgi:predicted kinase